MPDVPKKSHCDVDVAIFLDIVQILPLLLVPAVTVGSIVVTPLAWGGAWLVQKSPEDPMACDSPSAKLSPSIMTSKSTWGMEKSSKSSGLFYKGLVRDTVLDCIGCTRSERICAAWESPASCCQQMVLVTSGLPWCVVSKKPSNQQWYWGDTHPVIKLSTR